MKRNLLIALTGILMAGAPLASAQLTRTDHLAVSSGVKLWLRAWTSSEVAAKLEPLYRADVVTRLASAPEAQLRNWAAFLKVISQNRITSEDTQSTAEPNIVSEGDRAIASLPSGVRLVWEKTNGVWRIIDQSLPAWSGTLTVSADQ